MLGTNAVDAPEALDQPHRVPVQVVVDDVVTVLQVEPLGEHVGGDQRVDLQTKFSCAGVVGIGAGREAGHDARLALVLAVDDLDIGSWVCRGQVIVEILGGVGVLGEDEYFPCWSAFARQQPLEPSAAWRRAPGDGRDQGRIARQDLHVVLHDHGAARPH